MKRVFGSLCWIVGMVACATETDVRPPPGLPALVEPVSRPVDPHRATVPRDLKDLGAMTPRWIVPGGPWARLHPEAVIEVQPDAQRVHGRSLKNGAAMWTAELPGLLARRPVITEGWVAVWTEHALVGLEPASGKVTFRRTLSASDAMAKGRFLTTGPADGTPFVIALNAGTGDEMGRTACPASCRVTDVYRDRAVVSFGSGWGLVDAKGQMKTIEAPARARQLLLTDTGWWALDGGVLLSSSGTQRTVSPESRLGRTEAAVLMTDGAGLEAIDPDTGLAQWRIDLGPDLRGNLRVDEARHFPEGQSLVPTEPLFGDASVYLLVRDDGTLRAVRYGLPEWVATDGHKAMALYVGKKQLMLSGTRRRGAPVRHYETVAEDVAGQLDLLMTAGADPAVRARVLAWLQRLGRPIWEMAAHAAIAGAPPEGLRGLVWLLSPDVPADRPVAREVLYRLASRPAATSFGETMAQAERVVGQWPEDLPRVVMTPSAESPPAPPVKERSAKDRPPKKKTLKRSTTSKRLPRKDDNMLSTTAIIATVGALASQIPADTAEGYKEILATHVKNGRVDYKAIANQDMAKLDAYVDAVAKATLPKGKNARMAFYIDAYNALVLRSVIKNGRPRSVLDVKGFFNAQKHTVAGKTVTLDSLEKKELNPFAKDPRTHFVLVCAAVGCPILESTPFTGSKLNQRMNRATRRYLTSPTGAQVEEERLKLSKIFDWYKGDFGGEAGVLAFVRKHLPKGQAAKLGGSPDVSFIDYNWTLNQR